MSFSCTEIENIHYTVELLGSSLEVCSVSSDILSPLFAFFLAAKRSFSFFSLPFSSRRVEVFLSKVAASSSATPEYEGRTGGD